MLGMLDNVWRKLWDCWIKCKESLGIVVESVGITGKSVETVFRLLEKKWKKLGDFWRERGKTVAIARESLD